VHNRTHGDKRKENYSKKMLFSKGLQIKLRFKTILQPSRTEKAALSSQKTLYQNKMANERIILGIDPEQL
jgi:hypothetical protein